MDTNIRNNKFDFDSALFSLFCALLFFIPFNTRKIFISKYTDLSGYYNDFLTYSLYLTDIIFVILLIFIVFKKRNSLFSVLSGVAKSFFGKMLIMFYSWILISSFVNFKYFDISIYQIVRISEGIILACIVMYLINDWKRLILSLILISISGVLQSIIALIQFITQSSIFGNGFLHKLFGESIIGRDIVGVSNFIFDGEKIIRSYGTFPHPNILAGYLVITILITLYLATIRTETGQKVKYGSYSVQRVLQFVMAERILYFFVIIQYFGLFVTFSRSAWLSLLIVICVNLFAFKIVSRGTIYTCFRRCISISKLNVSSFITRFLLLLVVFVTLTSIYFFTYRMRYEFVNHQSFNNRVFLENVSRETIIDNPIFGVGIGSYILNMHDKFAYLYYWEYQPDHNLYLLIAAEIGMVGLIIYLAFLFNLYKSFDVFSAENEYHMKYLKNLLQSIILVVIILGIFDHYFWTSNQARLIFWITIGYIFAMIVNSKNVPRETL